MEDRKGKGIMMESGSNNSDEEFLNLIPLGYRFCPTDEELVHIYLKKKVLNEPLPTPNTIRVVNVYKFHPDRLFDMYNLPRDEALYVFTKTEKKHTNGKRTNRVISDGIGYWKGRQSDKRVLDNNGNVIWSRVSLVFQEGKSKGSVKTNWLMQEYRVGDRDKLDEWVLCKIYLHMNKNERAIQSNDGVPNEAALSVVASPLEEVAYSLAVCSLGDRTFPSSGLGMCTDGPFYSRVQPNTVDSSGSMLVPLQVSSAEKSYEATPLDYGERQSIGYYDCSNSHHFTSTMGYPPQPLDSIMCMEGPFNGGLQPNATDSGSMLVPLQVSSAEKSYEETPLDYGERQNIGYYNCNDSHHFTSTMGYPPQPLDSIMCMEGPFNGGLQPNATDSGSMLVPLQVSSAEKSYEETPLDYGERQNIGYYDCSDSHHLTSTMGYPRQPLDSIMCTEGPFNGRVQPNATDYGSMLAPLQVSIGEKSYEEIPFNPLSDAETQNAGVYGSYDSNHFTSTIGYPPEPDQPLDSIMFSDDYMYNTMVNESFFQGGANP